MTHYVVRRAPWRKRKTGKYAYVVIRKPTGKEVQVSAHATRESAFADANRRNRQPVAGEKLSGEKKRKRSPGKKEKAR